MDQVTQFVGEKSHPFIQRPHAVFGNDDLTAMGKFRDRARNGIVETSIQRTKLLGLDGHVVFERHLADGLT